MAPGPEPDPGVRVAVNSAALLGESPFWHPTEKVLYYTDIPGHRLQRFDPASGALTHWDFDTDVASCAPLLDGRLLLAMRDGLWKFNPATGARTSLAKPPYDLGAPAAAEQRQAATA
jgi:sugar lactone lactonase YvrE